MNNKKSWLLTRAFEKAGGLRPKLIEAMGMPVDTDEQKALKVAVVKEIYAALALEEEAKQEIIRLHNEALGYVAQLGLGEEAEAILEAYATKLIGRTK